MAKTAVPIALLSVLVLAAGCTESGGKVERGRPTPPAGTPPASSAPAPRVIHFDLYTHCGIDEARIGSTYFEARTPLSDGAGNPPDGWDNPTQRGTMTLKSATEAVFTDGAGHAVTFRARSGASTFKRICA
ncbi:hypothetical protein [Streptomyces sp. H39-S7]|uniref:hypothetical protein n=1 Tax=Streptomyces sp. H39-S7 TaxID=3004357 RepID=UPI0022AED2B4|nr:hypothetical protein [Streptomyces sp. H39-S7]MCZ4125558.1 hypothetical protein [Streptomyces sp. H39-S7]